MIVERHYDDETLIGLLGPTKAIAEVTAAGFTLEAQSDLLKNPADPKNVGVRDPSVQGETEKFALRFRKPG